MPPLTGYEIWHAGESTQSKGVAIYHRAVLKVRLLDNNNERLIAGTVGDLLVIVVYAPTECTRREIREDFFAEMMAFISTAQASAPGHHTILAGDFNAQIRGQGHNENNSNGELLASALAQLRLHLVPQRRPTFSRESCAKSTIDHFAVPL
jgi:exonuclease III